MKNIDSHFSVKSSIVLCNDDAYNCLLTLPDNQFRLVVSSPPYNIGKEYEKKIKLQQYIDWQTTIIKEIYRITASDGSIVWQVGNYVSKGEIIPLDIYFYPIFKALGLQLRNRIVWHFAHGLHASKRLSGRYEMLLWFTKNENYIFNLDAIRVSAKYPGKLHYKGDKKGLPSGNPLGKNPSDYWNFIYNEWESGIIDIPNVKANHPEKTIHPCQFPVELIERFVLALTNETDWILDPFGGVGSSVIAAIKHQRRGMSIEKDRNYISVARQRVIDFQNGILNLRPLGKQIYVPTGNEKISQIPLEWKKMI
jgi:DNA modification methylase